MPPKRGARAASVARSGTPRAASRSRGTPAPSLDDVVGSEDEGSPAATRVLRSGRTPGPSRFNSSYGSPPVLTGSRNINTISATSAIGSVLQNVQAANVEDRGARKTSNAQAAQGKGEDEQDVDARAMPPPPRPSGKSPARGSRQSSVASDGPEAARIGRLGSEPPSSDSRSFIEESNIFGGANLRAATTQNASRAPPSPTRSSARIAAKTNTRADSVPPSPARPSSSNLSFSIDDDDEEDPLANPTPRGVAKSSKSQLQNQTPSDRQSASPVQPRKQLSSQVQQPKAAASEPKVAQQAQASQQRPASQSSSSQRLLPPERFPFPQPQQTYQSFAVPRPGPAQQIQGSQYLRPKPRPVGPNTQPVHQSYSIAAPGFRDLQSGSRGFRRVSPDDSDSDVDHVMGNQSQNSRPAASMPAANGRSTGVEALGNGNTKMPTSRTNIPPNTQNNVASIPASPTNHGINQASRSNGRNVRAQTDDTDENEDEDDTVSFIAMLLDMFLNFFKFRTWARNLKKLAAVWGIAAFLCMIFMVLLGAFIPASRWEGVRVGKNYTYFDPLTDWRQNAAQLIPWIVLHPFSVLTGNLDYADYRNTLHWLEINTQQNKIRMDHLAHATYEMRRILPELIAIRVDQDTKEWTVEDSFWYAMHEQMMHGGLLYNLLSMEKDTDGVYTLSDPSWNAISHRIQREGYLLSDVPSSGNNTIELTSQVTAYVDEAVTQVWKDWLKQNQDGINRVRGDTKDTPSAHWQDLYGDVEKAVAQRIKDLGLEEHIITKEEFIQEIQHQSNQYAAQIKAEMLTMQSKVDRAVEIAEEAKRSPQTPDGMSSEEVEHLVNEAVRRGIANAQLESVAKGNIKSSLESDILKRKNYFSGIRGAIIDQTLTSGTYVYQNPIVRAGRDVQVAGWTSRRRNKQQVFRDGGRDTGVTFASGKVLENWEEDGECWCAGTMDAKNLSGVADLSIFTTETVVPQHLVVEHISPMASFDPNAMPKDIEVWIRAPEDKRRRSLDHWAEQRWADVKQAASRKLRSKGFVKVGEFQYDNSITKGERQVFKLSDDLLNMNAQTQQVLVRAKTNYGSKDHTCFYRLQLFGEEGRSGTAAR